MAEEGIIKGLLTEMITEILLRVTPKDLDPEKSCEVIALNLPLEEELEDRMEVPGSCKGILCQSNDAHTVYLWNPSSTECVKLPDISFDVISNLLRPLAFGFGYPAATDQSK
ncbi:hypothetical protein GIB67_040638, partial [Kingdonia uniflora]